MTAASVQAAPLDLDAIRVQVDSELAQFISTKADAGRQARLPEEITTALSDFLFAGGKRIRPLLCALGWLAGGVDATVPAAVLRAAAALELFHASVLIHDDIIDNSNSRRDRPTVHRALGRQHFDRRDPARFGADAAIILGDLAMVWSAELLHTAQLSTAQLVAALGVLDAMRADVMYGQYLDLFSTGYPTSDVDRALRIIRYKTVAYTCEHPLHLGAALADSGSDIRNALTAYARPLGEAFQLRDDLLGVYGDPARTGKSNLDDLRDGKHTALVALALRHAAPDDAAQLRTLIGNPDLDEPSAARCREILTATAKPRVEEMINARWNRAQLALNRAPFPEAVTHALRQVADAAVARAV